MNKENNELKRFDHSSDSGFWVPDGYFEGLKSEIDRKIVASRLQSRRVRNRWIYSSAASIALVLGLSIYFSLVEKGSDLATKGVQLTHLAMDSNRHAIAEKTVSNPSLDDVAATALTEENQDLIDDELIATADELNLTDEELVELTEYIDL